jgi:hypothetical protein
MSLSDAALIRNSTARQARQIFFGGRRLFHVAAIVVRQFCFKLESTSRSEIAGCHRDLLRAQYIARGFGRVPAISLQIPNAVKERLR